MEPSQYASRGNRLRKRTWPALLLSITVLIFLDFAGARLLFLLQADSEIPKLERKYRVESEIYHHDLKKRYNGIGWWGNYYPVTTNSLGFKDTSTRPVTLRAALRRVLLIGDSFTEGIGLEYKKSYAGLITDSLAKRGIEVLNAAVASYSPAIYYSKTRYLLEDLGLEFHELVAFLDISDIQDEAVAYRLLPDGSVAWRHPYQIAPRATPLSKMKQTLKSNSMMVQLADRVKDRLQGESDCVAEYPLDMMCHDGGNLARSLWTIDETVFDTYGKKGLEIAGKNMTNLADLLRAHSIPLTIVVYPWPDQVRYDSEESKQVVYWREWARNNGARFINVFPPFFQGDDAQATIDAYYIDGDVHFNEHGSNVVARAFLDAYSGAAK